MLAISRQQLKQEIDNLDPQYLDLVYNILRQFPHGEQKKPMENRPSPKIAGKGRILGDIMSPVVDPEDWNALQ